MAEKAVTAVIQEAYVQGNSRARRRTRRLASHSAPGITKIAFL